MSTCVPSNRCHLPISGSCGSVPLLVPPRGVIRPPLPPCRVGSSSPECSVPHYLLPAPLPANLKGLGVEKQNPSRRARRLPPSRRLELQVHGVVPNGTCLLKVRSFPAHAPNVVATRSGKQTHSDGQCRYWSAVYYTGGPRVESPLRQGLQPVFVKTLYTLSV